VSGKPVTLASLKEHFPDIPWEEPIPVTVEGKRYMGCRVCIAQKGLRGSDVMHGNSLSTIPLDEYVPAFFEEHMRMHKK
jgi:hypothetical protein